MRKWKSRIRPFNLRDTLKARVQKPSGPPPICEDWTPDVPRLDPQYTRIGPPMYLHWTPDVQGQKTQHPPDEDQGLPGSEDFVGFRTSWDSRLRGTRDFMGSRTRQDNRTPTHIGSESCSVVSSYNTNFQDKIKTWTPLGIRLVDSVINCVLFSWLFGARTMPTGLYRAT